jgi:hypothetical protein
MMKNLFLPVLLLLAACGGRGNGDDIVVEFDRPADQVAAALAGLDAQSSLDVAFSQTQVRKEEIDRNTLNFHFIAPKDDEHPISPAEANFLFRIQEIAPGRTRVAVEVDVPQVEMPSAGHGMVLSQGKVINELKKALEAYATSIKTGGESSMALENVDSLFASVALAMDTKTMRNVASSQYGAVDFGGLMGGDEAYAADPDYGEPMDDAAPTTETAYSDSEESYAGADDGGWGAQE